MRIFWQITSAMLVVVCLSGTATTAWSQQTVPHRNGPSQKVYARWVPLQSHAGERKTSSPRPPARFRAPVPATSAEEGRDIVYVRQVPEHEVVHADAATEPRAKIRLVRAQKEVSTDPSPEKEDDRTPQTLETNQDIQPEPDLSQLDPSPEDQPPIDKLFDGDKMENQMRDSTPRPELRQPESTKNGQAERPQRLFPRADQPIKQQMTIEQGGEYFTEEGYLEPMYFDEQGFPVGECGTGCVDGSCGLGGQPPHGAFGFDSMGNSAYPLWPNFRQVSGWLFDNMTLFAGTNAHKSFLDQGRNGNFGATEGFNWGGPLCGPFNMSAQIGLRAVQTNFSGNRTQGTWSRADHDQIFWTAGFFKRASYLPVQGGVVIDMLHDYYYDTFNTGQVRTEVSYFSRRGAELGFLGAFNVRSETAVIPLFSANPIRVKSTDYYSFFIRKQFQNGGEGRLITGLTHACEAMISANFDIPLSDKWSLENSFTYIIPKEGNGVGAQEQETWGLMIQLSWYPHGGAYCKNPYRPLFDVADNTSLMWSRR